MSKEESIDWHAVGQLAVTGRLADPYIESSVRKLAQIVCTKYFSDFNASFREELISEAVLKAYQLLQAAHFDPNRPVKPFLYQGMRNNMSNFAQKNCKEVQMPEFHPEVEADPDINVWDKVSMPFSLVQRVFSRHDFSYQKYVPWVVDALDDLGLRLEGVPSQCWSDSLFPKVLKKDKSGSPVTDKKGRAIWVKPPFPPHIKESTCDKFICLIIWEKMEQIRYEQ